MYTPSKTGPQTTSTLHWHWCLWPAVPYIAVGINDGATDPCNFSALHRMPARTSDEKGVRLSVSLSVC